MKFIADVLYNSILQFVFFWLLSVEYVSASVDVINTYVYKEPFVQIKMWTTQVSGQD